MSPRDLSLKQLRARLEALGVTSDSYESGFLGACTRLHYKGRSLTLVTYPTRRSILARAHVFRDDEERRIAQAEIRRAAP